MLSDVGLQAGGEEGAGGEAAKRPGCYCLVELLRLVAVKFFLPPVRSVIFYLLYKLCRPWRCIIITAKLSN